METTLYNRLKRPLPACGVETPGPGVGPEGLSWRLKRPLPACGVETTKALARQEAQDWAKEAASRVRG
jgi:hypothetical protein